MAKKTLAGIGLTGFWPLGDDTWKPEMDENLQVLSVLVNRSVLSRTTALPGSPTEGDIYIVPTGETNEDDVAVYGYNPSTEATEWVYFTPNEGWHFWVQDDEENVQWTGAAWEVFAGSGGGSAGYPSFTDNAGKVLAVNEAEDDVEWVDQAAGGGAASSGLGFRAVPTATEGLSVGAHNPAFGTVVFDTTEGFDESTSEFTVPADLDGEVMVFFASIGYAAGEDCSLYIQRDTGAGYENLFEQHTGTGVFGTTGSTGPLEVSAGDKFRVGTYNGSAADTAVAKCSFSGMVLAGAGGSASGSSGPSVFLALSDSGHTASEGSFVTGSTFANVSTETGIDYDNASGEATLTVDAKVVAHASITRGGGFDIAARIEVDYGGVDTWEVVAVDSSPGGETYNPSANATVILELSAGDKIRFGYGSGSSPIATYAGIASFGGGGGGGGGGFAWEEQIVTNGNFGTGDATGWTNVTGSSDIGLASTGYQTAGAAPTDYIYGGGAQAWVQHSQDISVEAGAAFFLMTADSYKDYADDDRAFIQIEQYDVDDTFLDSERHYMSQASIGYEFLNLMVNAHPSVSYARLHVGVDRNTGTNNNAGLTNVKFFVSAAGSGGGGGGGSMTGAAIALALDSHFGNSEWRYSPSQVATAMDTLFGNSDWRNAAPTLAAKHRYWRLEDFGATMALAEIEFIDENGERLSGTFSAVNVVSGSSIAGSQDNNTSTYWGSGTATSDPWFAVDLGAGNEAVISAIALTAHDHRKPVNGFGLYYSDDGSTWTLIHTEGATTYANFERKEFDVRDSTYGSYDATSIMVALDVLLGGPDWRSGGGIGVDTDTFDSGDTGKPLVWDNDAQEFVLGDPVGSFLLGGGMELIGEYDLTGESSVVVDHASDSINNYDRIHLVYSGAGGQFDIEFSNDGGSTTQNIWKWTDEGTASSHTQMEWGPTADNVANSLGHAVIDYLSLSGVPTVGKGFGAAVGGGTAMQRSAIAQDESVTNCLTIAKQDGGTFAGGTLYVIGEKKSRQPVEIAGRLTAAWTALDVVGTFPTMGTTFRAGVIGTARVDADPGQDIDVTVKDGTGATVATGTILNGTTSCDLTAGATVTVSDEVVLEATEAPGSATELTMIVRGEFA